METFANLAIGLLVPIAVSYLKNQGWPDALKLSLSLVLCLLVGAISTWVAGKADGSPWTWKDFIANSGLVFTSATAFYKTIFQATNFNRDSLEPGGPLASSRTPPDPAAQVLKNAADYARTRQFDIAGNEVDPKWDLEEDPAMDAGDRPRKARIYQ